MQDLPKGVGIDVLAQVVEQSPISVIITGVDGIIKYINSAFTKSTGYAIGELIGEKPSLLKSGVHTELFYKDLWETILRGDVWKGEILNKHKNGQLFWDSVTISPICNPSGELIYFVGQKENISERKEVYEEFLKESLSFRNLAEIAPIIICQINNDGTIIYSNNYYQKSWGNSRNIFTPLSGVEEAKLKKELDFVFSNAEQTTVQVTIDKSKEKNKTFLVKISPLLIDGDMDSSIFVAHDISELLSVRNTAQRHWKHIQLLAENVVDVIWMMDKKRKLNFVTPSIKALSGYSVNEFLQLNLSGHGFKDLEKRLKRLFKIAQKDHVEYWESSFRKKDGDTIWIETHGKAILNENGQVTGVIGIMRDISERKAFEQKILRSERKFRYFFENTNACILVVDIELNAIVDVNKAALKFYGYSPGEFYKLDIKEKMEGLLEASMAEASVASSDIQNVYAQRHCLKTGEYCDVEVFPGPVEVERRTLVYTIVQDVSQRKRAIEALKESESKKLALLKIIPELIFILNIKGEIIDFYTDDPKNLTLSPHKLLGREVRHVFPQGFCDRLYEAMDKAVNLQEIQMFDYRYKKNGQRYVVEEVRVISSGKDEVLAIIRDVTDQKNTEMELKRAWKEAKEAEKIKSSFLANISHEIRTPINAILGFGELLQNEVNKPEQVQFVNSILSSSRTLLNLIDDLLDFSKIEAGKMTVNKTNVNLRSLLSEIELILSIKQKEKGLEFKVDFDSDFPEYIHSDELRLRQILINIIGNAIKFTHEGGVYITVRGENHRLVNNKIYIDLKIEVEDTGIGISETNILQIFDAFKQQEMQDARKYGGTGLGLAITKSLLDLLNGTIHVESHEGAGSRFTVVLFEVETDSRQLIRSNVQEYTIYNTIFEPATILIADDVKDNREFLKEMFKGSPIKFLEARNGMEAITILKDLPPIGLAILDLRLSKIDGVEVAKYMKSESKYAHIPTIGVSATPPSFGDDARNVYLDEFITKPIAISDFIETMCKYLPYKKKEGAFQAKKDWGTLHGKVGRIQVKHLFEEYFIPVFEEVSKTSSFSDYDRFANLLIEKSEEFELGELSTIGRCLKEAAKSFDLDQINKLLADYSFLQAEVFKTDE